MTARGWMDQGSGAGAGGRGGGGGVADRLLGFHQLRCNVPFGMQDTQNLHCVNGRQLIVEN